MSKVVSKIRCYNPSQKNSISGNLNHLSYISGRNMAMFNEKGIATIGDVENIVVNETRAEELKQYLYKIATSKTNIYRGIISIREYDALELGYDKQNTWNDMMKRNIYDIGKKLNLSITGMEWLGVVHIKKGNPHIHYMIWDKNQKINRYFINTYKQDEIRKLLIKDIFSNELSMYYEELNNSKKTLRDKAISIEIKAFDNSKCLGKIAYINKLSDKEINNLLEKFKDIKNNLPKTGALKYSYMTSELKQKINGFIYNLLECNFELKNEYLKYIETSKKIGSLYGESEKKSLEKKAKEKLENILGNQVLTCIKQLNIEQFKKQVIIEGIIQNLFRTLSIIVESNEAKHELYKNYRGEMSKQAKRDYAKNKCNSSNIEWGI